MNVARLQLLDGFALERGGARLVVPVGIQHLIAFVALTGPTHRCLVAGTLWRDVPEAQALASLRTGIWRTNRLVPDLVRVDGDQLCPATSTLVDSRQQESFATQLLGHPSGDEPWIAEAIETPVAWRAAPRLVRGLGGVRAGTSRSTASARPGTDGEPGGRMVVRVTRTLDVRIGAEATSYARSRAEVLDEVVDWLDALLAPL